MNLTSPSQVRRLLGGLNVRPSKVLGQNFLIDKNILDILLKTADLSRNDKVLEVGPGLGVVTEQLLHRARHVTAVEKDSRLFDFLLERFEGEDRLDLICADMLKVDLCGEDAGRQGSSGKRKDVKKMIIGRIDKVVSNLPYSVASRILVNLIRAETPPRQIVITLQQEVARRLAAEPGNRNYGMLSVWAQLSYRVDPVKTVSPKCFRPEPEVSSVIVNMRRRSGSVPAPEVKTFFYSITKHAFSYRRKQLRTILSRAPGSLNVDTERTGKLLEKMGHDETARPEDLSVQDWCELAERCCD